MHTTSTSTKMSAGILALALVASILACGNNEDNNANNTTNNTAQDMGADMTTMQDMGGTDMTPPADMGGADMPSDMGGADMGGADMGGADMGGADMGGADMGGADMGGADMGGVMPQRFPFCHYNESSTVSAQREYVEFGVGEEIHVQGIDNDGDGSYEFVRHFLSRDAAGRALEMEQYRMGADKPWLRQVWVYDLAKRNEAYEVFTRDDTFLNFPTTPSERGLTTYFNADLTGVMTRRKYEGTTLTYEQLNVWDTAKGHIISGTTDTDGDGTVDRTDTYTYDANDCLTELRQEYAARPMDNIRYVFTVDATCRRDAEAHYLAMLTNPVFQITNTYNAAGELTGRVTRSDRQGDGFVEEQRTSTYDLSKRRSGQPITTAGMTDSDQDGTPDIATAVTFDETTRVEVRTTTRLSDNTVTQEIESRFNTEYTDKDLLEYQCVKFNGGATCLSDVTRVYSKTCDPMRGGLVGIIGARTLPPPM